MEHETLSTLLKDVPGVSEGSASVWGSRDTVWSYMQWLEYPEGDWPEGWGEDEHDAVVRFYETAGGEYDDTKRILWVVAYSKDRGEGSWMSYESWVAQPFFHKDGEGDPMEILHMFFATEVGFEKVRRAYHKSMDAFRILWEQQ